MFTASYRLFLLTFAAMICFSSVLLAAENDKLSLDKLIDQIDEIVGGGLAPESFEAKCSDDAKACNDEELCVRAINIINPRYKYEVKQRGLECGVIKSVSDVCMPGSVSSCSKEELCNKSTYKGGWVTSGDGLAFANEARKRGLDCGVGQVVVSNTCLTDPKLCSETMLCERATYRGGWVTAGDGLLFTNEARSRGLDCGIVKDYKTNFADWDDSTICAYATLNSQWKTANDFKAHVSEAKRRGLACGTKQVTISNTCKNNPTACSVTTLCKMATYKGGWITSGDGLPFTNEAKRRGIDCGISSNKSAGSNNFENYFKNLSFASRAQIQFSLQDLGYYKATVDGLWGRETAKAIADFRKANNLTNDANSYVFQTINRQAEIRSSSNASNSTNKTVYKCKFNPNLTNDWAPATLEFNTKTKKAKMWNKSSQASKANNVQRYTWYRNLQDTKGETFRVTYVLTLKNALTLNGFANSVDSELLIRVSSRQVEKSPGTCELIR